LIKRLESGEWREGALDGVVLGVSEGDGLGALEGDEEEVGDTYAGSERISVQDGVVLGVSEGALDGDEEQVGNPADSWLLGKTDVLRSTDGDNEGTLLGLLDGELE
jgi:hypothetical protein